MAGMNNAQEQPPPPQMAGMDIPALDRNAAALHATQSHRIGHQTYNNYRNRIDEMIKWIEKYYPAYGDEVIVTLTPEQRLDSRKYHNSRKDFRFNRLNPRFTQLFISGEKKFKRGGKQYNFDHLRKYNDAILYCAEKIEHVQLPPTYRPEMAAYLDTLEKEKTQAKKRGETDEKAADPINASLFKCICEWALDSHNIFVWAFSLVQWHVMGRSINVAPIGFHNFSRSLGEDTIVIKYDDNKADKKGVKTSPKNCYANPFDATVNLFLALGCYLCLNQDKYEDDKDIIFVKNGKDRSASDTYCKALREIVNSSEERKRKVQETCRPGHFHPYGTRKGSATHATTGTMEPAPIPSVMKRGEWTLGKVLDLYWKFSELGDYYLGRCLAFLDPDEENFSVLPPHFTLDNPLANEFVQAAMTLCFGPIIEKWGSRLAIEGILLLMLASMIYHSDWMLERIARDPSHPFQGIPILHRPELLGKLKELVTLEPAGKMQTATGVPRHTKLLKKISAVWTVAQASLTQLTEMTTRLPEIIKNAINATAAEAGQVTVPFVMELFEIESEKMRVEHAKNHEELKATILEVTQLLQPANPRTQQPVAAPIVQPTINDRQRTMGLWRDYVYGRGSYAVPSDFRFPKSSLRQAWVAWLFGFQTNPRKPVRPLRFITMDTMLPAANRVRKTFCDEWKPVMNVFLEVNRAKLANTRAQKDITPLFEEDTFQAGKTKLEMDYPALFQCKNARRHKTWTVATWSRKVREEKRKKRIGLGQYNMNHEVEMTDE